MSADEHVTDAELDERSPDLAERLRLEHWATIDPPEGFADRVMLRSPRPPKRRRRYAVAAACALAIAGGSVAYLSLGARPKAASGGAVVSSSRMSTVMATRGTAVAERGASFTWEVAPDGDATVEQSAGDVFYRVEPGGSFVVNTAAGQVRVKGTCFRVEVQMKKQIVGGVIGAAVAVAVVVSVYEGGVVVAGHDGPPRSVGAGESVTLPLATPTAIATTARADISAMTSEQIVARDKAQTERISQLEAKVKELEAASTTAAATAAAAPSEFELRPSKEKLLEWAKTCTVGVDYPSVQGQTWTPVEAGGRYSKGDVAAVNAAFSELHAEWLATVRAAYVEVTGDEAGARTMSAAAMASELADKGAEEEIDAIRARVADERAGLRPPPAPGAKMSALEKYVRGMLALGDTAEAALAKRLGPARAAAIRGQHWDSFGTWTGCPPER